MSREHWSTVDPVGARACRCATRAPRTVRVWSWRCPRCSRLWLRGRVWRLLPTRVLAVLVLRRDELADYRAWRAQQRRRG
jgi:hypothetical protein